MATEVVKRPGRRMPHPYVIAHYWLTQEHRFPENPGYWIGLGEPYCFGCGWLAPVEDGLGRQSWTWAARFLDRAHLVDRWLGDGLDDVQNLVMLCHDCHEEMPPFLDGDDALLWVRARERWESRLHRRMAPFLEAFSDELESIDPLDLAERFVRWERERKAASKLGAPCRTGASALATKNGTRANTAPRSRTSSQPSTSPGTTPASPRKSQHDLT